MKKVLRFMIGGNRYQVVITDKKRETIIQWFKDLGVEFPNEATMKHFIAHNEGLWLLMLRIWGIPLEILDAEREW